MNPEQPLDCVSAAQNFFKKLKYVHFLFILGHLVIISGYKNSVERVFTAIKCKNGSNFTRTVCNS